MLHHKISLSLSVYILSVLLDQKLSTRDLSRQFIPNFTKSDVVIKRESCVVSSLFNLKSNIPIVDNPGYMLQLKSELF